MRRHIVAPFGAVLEVIGIFWHEPIKKLFQVAPRGWVRIFHDDNAATGVLNENSHCPHSYSRPVDLRLHLAGDFVKSLAAGSDFESIVLDAHYERSLCMGEHQIKTRFRDRFFWRAALFWPS
jgi:hypothetical protein